MNKLLTKIVGAALGLTMTVGVGVAVANSNNAVEPVRATSGTYTIGWGASGTNQTFSATTGTVTFAAGHTASFECAKNSSANAPAYNSTNKQLRLYYASNGSGGSVTFSLSDVTITGFVITSATGPTLKYSVDGAAAVSMSASSNTYTVSGISATTSLMFQNGNTSNTQLQISTIQFSYSYGGEARTLSGISVATAPTKVTYTEGEKFDPTGLVINRTWSSGDPDTYTYAGHTSEFSFTPSTSTALTTSDNSVTISYGGKTTTQAITVNAVPTLIEDGDYYIGFKYSGTTYYANDASSVNSYGAPLLVGASSAQKGVYTITRVIANTYTIQLGTDYLVIGKSDNNGIKFSSTLNDNAKWTAAESGDGLTFINVGYNTRYLSNYQSTDVRCYTNSCVVYLEEASTDPEITEVTMSGSPAASANIAGGSQWTMSATVSAINDEGETLSRNVNWTVSPANAVTFSKTTSSSGENITVTAENSANNNVVITAASAATGFTTIKATSNSFNITKSYSVNTNTLVTKDGASSYNAGGASSKTVAFISTLTYSGDAGEYKTNLSVSPNTGVTLSESNPFVTSAVGSEFSATFSSNGTYTITSTPIENAGKAASVTITISNIVVSTFDLVKDSSTLANGTQFIIHSTYEVSSTTYQKVLTTTQNSNNISSENLAISNDSVLESTVRATTADVLTLVQGQGYWLIKSSVSGDKYLHGVSNQAYLRAETLPEPITDEFKFDISINSTTGVASIVSRIDNSKRIQLNSGSGSGVFAFYAGTQKDVGIYALPNNSPYFSISETNMYLGVRGELTLSVTAHNGAAATVTWAIADGSKATLSSTSGTSITVTGVAVGDTTITASFTPTDGNTYGNLVCDLHVVAIDDYVSIGVTTFTKVTSEPAGGWEGTYLIVDETLNLCFDGSASPLMPDSTKAVSISDNKIVASTSMINSSFNIKETATADVYTLRSNSGFYVGGGEKTIHTSVGEAYQISIDSDGTIQTVGGSYSMRYNSAQGNVFRFYATSTGDALTLYKADGERRAITSTLTSWYDNVKENEYLVCHESGIGSLIDWDNLSDSATDLLTSQDLDTLKTMTAKSAEDNGNYLEDFISDYDYLVINKGYDDFLGRFDEGGAMYGTPRVVPMPISNIVTTNGVIAIVVVISMMTVTAIGAYYFLRKRKEQ